MSIGENVRTHRVKRGLDQRELALILGVSSPTISNIERNVKMPSIKTINRLSIALKCKVADLIQE